MLVAPAFAHVASAFVPYCVTTATEAWVCFRTPLSDCEQQRPTWRYTVLQRIEVRNFQSLHDISLDLSRFTVIEGPSSSGKSAFVRALHTLVNNRRGLDFLTHGERTCTITATNEHSTVTLSRGKSTDENFYVVTPTAPPSTSHPQEPERWSKLGGAVPEEVTAALGLQPGQGPFARQHDMPYLLSDGSSAVASTLGALTNVNVIFEAARRAKNQAADASKTLRLRAADHSQATAALAQFEDVDAQQHALSRAEEKISEAYRVQRSLNALTAARDSLIAAASTLKRLSSAADISIPDVTPAIEAHQRLMALTAARDALISAAGTHRDMQQRMNTLDVEQRDLDDERNTLRQDTAQVFEEAMLKHSDGAQDIPYIAVHTAATIAAETVEELST